MDLKRVMVSYQKKNTRIQTKLARLVLLNYQSTEEEKLIKTLEWNYGVNKSDEKRVL